ncbi:MAG: bifunctional 4-hydroxy-2-oxoglutarate aldolase/2-dehydro-3-deoxy-phosphogluconate aldolase [Lachnospiraceae bacterium]|nr:bifunctional 4-hydroxy-2-oxoglutarate aldolase/2-dehydro-3-deoxy-phosphogluconate aldolase [Lachnospiraceae bacterium]
MRNVVIENPILAIMRNVPEEKLIPYAEAVVNGGVRFFEVAMNTPGAARQIRILKDHFKDDVYIGAGTAITLDRVKAAVSAGARFLLTPSTDRVVVLYCEENNIPLMPGVMTPTDVSFCYQHGFKTLKLFPAGDLPQGYVKNLKGPFDGTEYVAIGGVTPDNIGDFIQRGFIGVGLASAMMPKRIVEKNMWDEGAAYVASLKRRVEEALGKTV